MTLEERIIGALREPVAPDQFRALDLRVRAVLDATPVRRRRRLSVTRALVLAGLVALALPGLITGAMFFTENPLGLADAREFTAEIEAAKLAVTLPEDRTWPSFFRVDDSNGSYSRGGAQPWAESIAMCMWFDDWLDARATNDAPREAVAAATVAKIPSWPSWDSPFYDQSYRDYYGPIIAAVGKGNPGPVKADVNCSWAIDK